MVLRTRALGWIAAAFASVVLNGPAPCQAQVSLLAGLREQAEAAPDDYGAQLALARGLTRAGDYAAAERVLTRANAQAPSPSVATLRLAEVWVQSGNYKRARNTCRSRLLEQRGKDPYMHLCLARTYLAWNRSSRAFDELEELRGEPALRAEAELIHGDALRLRFQATQARAAYAKAKADPTWRADAELGLARLELGLGRRKAALEALGRALEAQPEMPEAQLELGRLLAPSPEGVALLEAALDNRPGWALAAHAVGDARLAQGDAVGAEQAYRVALQTHQEDFAAHRGVGRALLAQGKLDAAEAALKLALDLYPTDAQTTLAMAELLLARGEVDTALEQLRRAADLDPGDTTALLRAAEVCLHEHYYTLASGYLDRLLGAHPQSARGLALYGDVLRARGRESEARDFYQRALVGEGLVDHERVKAALAELQ